MNETLKRLAARMPHRWQQTLKRHYFAQQISRARFLTDEPEYALLDQLVAPGDWVLDIGANIGHYTARLSELVGTQGRVFAFEPIPDTFEILTANATRFRHRNVTLLNVAASDTSAVASMTMPLTDSGLPDYYRAHIEASGDGVRIVCLPVDSLALPQRISLVKIDAEGTEREVLAGMTRLIERDRPTLIVEGDDPEIGARLERLGYTGTHLPESPNILYRRLTA